MVNHTMGPSNKWLIRGRVPKLIIIWMRVKSLWERRNAKVQIIVAMLSCCALSVCTVGTTFDWLSDAYTVVTNATLGYTLYSVGISTCPKAILS